MLKVFIQSERRENHRQILFILGSHMLITLGILPAGCQPYGNLKLAIVGILYHTNPSDSLNWHFKFLENQLINLFISKQFLICKRNKLYQYNQNILDPYSQCHFLFLSSEEILHYEPDMSCFEISSFIQLTKQDCA